MSDRLLLHGIAAECRLGVSDWERERPQTVGVDVELAIDAKTAAKQDAIAAAVDYSRVVTTVKTVAQGTSFALLETLAEALASRLLAECAARWIRVRVKKKALPGIDYAAVEVERTVRRLRRGRVRENRRPARSGAQ